MFRARAEDDEITFAYRHGGMLSRSGQGDRARTQACDLKTGGRETLAREKCVRIVLTATNGAFESSHLSCAFSDSRLSVSGGNLFRSC